MADRYESIIFQYGASRIRSSSRSLILGIVDGLAAVLA
jgi:hypothetical protein